MSKNNKRKRYSRQYSEEQNDIDKKLFESETLKSIYEHFSLRHNERYVKDKATILSYGDYYNIWVCKLRGYLVSKNELEMVRYIGSYMKDETIYKIIYNKVFGVFVPITIYEVTDNKKKWRMYQAYLRNKKSNL